MGLGLTLTQDAFEMMKHIDPMSPDFEQMKNDFLNAIGAAQTNHQEIMMAVEEWFEEALMEACGYDDYCEPDAPTY